MTRKHSEEYIIQTMKIFGFTWLSGEYINNKSILIVRCENNHEIETNFNHIDCGCPVCNKEQKLENIRLKNLFLLLDKLKERNWELLSEHSEYKDPRTKLKIKGDCDHIFLTSHSMVDIIKNCPKCVKNRKKEDEEIAEKLKEKGWRFNYRTKINNKTVYNCFCDKNHNINIHRLHRDCPICLGRIITTEDARAIVESRSWKLLSEYEGSRVKLRCLCDKGDEIEMILRKIKANYPCPICSKNTGIAKPLEEIKAILKSYNLTLLNEEDYKNQKSILIVKCDNDHICETTFLKLQTALNKCKKCFPVICHSEKVILNYLNSNTAYNWKKIKPDWLNYKNSNNKHFNLEIDCYCEEINTGIEIDGNQHFEFPNHFQKTLEEYNKQIERDRYKDQRFKELNKTLIRIRTLDYYDSEEIMLCALEELLVENKIIKEEDRKYKDQKEELENFRKSQLGT